MTRILVLLCCIGLLGCSSPFSESIIKGVDAVVNFYGAKATYSIGIENPTYSVSTAGLSREKRVTGKFIGINLLKSKVLNNLDRYKLTPAMIASNSALLFFRNISPDEKQKYNFVRIRMAGTDQVFDYSFNTLKLVDSNFNKAEEVIKCLATNKRLSSLAHPMLMRQYTAAQEELVRIDSTYGEIEEFSLQGFAYVQDAVYEDKKRSIIRYSGVLVRRKQSTDFSIIIDATPSKNYLLGHRFEK